MTAMTSTLEEIDERFSAYPGFRHVAPLVIVESGVDPVGMRQINLDLMDAAVPGINNVVDHVRPYSFMAWAWWRARRTLEQGGNVDPAQMCDLVKRYEALYQWSHLLAGRLTKGANALRRHLPAHVTPATFRFEGAAWQRLGKDMLSFMAPTEYGPSIKALRWLRPLEGEAGLFRISKVAEPAVEVIDALVSAHMPKRLLAAEPPTVACDEVLPFAECLPADRAEPAEMVAFRELFHGAASQPEAHRDFRRRAASIDLLRGHLLEAGKPLALPAIRRLLAVGGQPMSHEGEPEEVALVANLHCILQARQLQRLATEATMLWIESNIGRDTSGARTSAYLAALADRDARNTDNLAADAPNVGTYMDAVEALGAEVGWPAAAAAAGTDVLELVGRLGQAQASDRAAIPGLSLRAFAVVRAVSRGVRARRLPKAASSFLERRPDRLPFEVIEKQIDATRDKSLAFFWRQVVEQWVIGQHVHWSAVRGGDGKKRLRIGLEGEGWIRVRPETSGRFEPTPDRLLRLLLLGAECGLFAKDLSGAEPVFTIPKPMSGGGKMA